MENNESKEKEHTQGMEDRKSVTVSVPLFVTLPRKTKADKKVILNLNNYRNLHRFTEGQCKKEYKRIVEPILKGLKLTKRVSLVFTYYKPSNRISDRANVLSIVEKYFSDALVELGYLEDDNDNFIESTHYYSGGLDTNNPRVDVEIIAK